MKSLFNYVVIAKQRVTGSAKTEKNLKRIRFVCSAASIRQAKHNSIKMLKQEFENKEHEIELITLLAEYVEKKVNNEKNKQNGTNTGRKERSKA